MDIYRLAEAIGVDTEFDKAGLGELRTYGVGVHEAKKSILEQRIYNRLKLMTNTIEKLGKKYKS